MTATAQETFQTLDVATHEPARMALLRRVALEGARPADVAALREMLEESALSRAEADALAAIDAAPTPKCDEWAAFFIDVITDHVLWQCRPTGVVNESQGEWLIALADRSGSRTALGALAGVLAEAHRVPLWFVAAVRARLSRLGDASRGLTLVA
jgi:hypothetical protein